MNSFSLSLLKNIKEVSGFGKELRDWQLKKEEREKEKHGPIFKNESWISHRDVILN